LALVFVSVTRLRLRSLRFFPVFAWHTWASTRQLRRAPGFVSGQLAGEGSRGYWTITGWTNEAAMRRYRNTDAHQRAMPKLLRWCDEASVAHWKQDDPALPGPAEALDRMVREGRLSKLRHPSLAHAAGQIAPARRVPQAGLPLRPGPAGQLTHA
jgi:hypothetical protein